MTKKALFLDRDGVINIDYGYVYNKDSIDFVDGIFELCVKAKKKGYIILIVTNQSGIGRGYFTDDQYKKLAKWIENCFKEKEVIIEKTYYCPHHKEANISSYKKDCYFRKPNPGMILKAIKDYNIDPKKSILIGDKASDILAGRAAGIKTNIFFKNKLYSIPKVEECILIKNINDAIRYL